MKKIILLLNLLSALVMAQSYLVSDIPLPKTYVMDTDPYECDEVCLQELLASEQIFSFMAHANHQLSNKELDEARLINAAVLNIGHTTTGKKFRIALLLPYKKIGKYSTSTTNTVFAYLMSKNTPFMMKSYKIEDENLSTIQETLAKIEADGIGFVIAPLTKKGVENLITLDPTLKIYIPTINKHSLKTNSSHFIFGGIDYYAQSDLLLQEATPPLIIFSGKSQTGRELALYQEQRFIQMEPEQQEKMHEEMIQELQADGNITLEKPWRAYKYFISPHTTNLENYLKENEKIVEGSFFINTPVIKSGMIMSQLTLYDLNASNILSTQINYNPLILSMTQYKDREHMLIANSITKKDTILNEVNTLIGNDIEYDWINYSTAIGVDYFYSKTMEEVRVYNIPIVGNQVYYEIELLRPLRTRFATYLPAQSTLPPPRSLEKGED